MAEMRRLDLRQPIPDLTLSMGGCLTEAASVCLEEQGHDIEVTLAVSSSLLPSGSENFAVVRLPVTPQMRASHAEPTRATENGACGIAIVLMQILTGLVALEQSRIGTGFDYHLGTEPLDFQARLEVSGIRTGARSQINTRRRIKQNQTRRSDESLGDRTAYSVIVEFSQPQAVVDQR